MKKILFSLFLIFALVGCHHSSKNSNNSYEQQLETYKTEMFKVIKPSSPITHYHSGNAILSSYDTATEKTKAGILAQAIGEYKTAIDLDPSFAPAHYALAIAYFKGNEVDKSVETLDKCLSINPNFSAAYFAMGLILEKQGKIELAQEKYLKTIELNPADVNPYLLLSDIEIKNKNYKQAKAYLEEVLKINSNNKIANAGIQYLEEKITTDEVQKPEEKDQKVTEDKAKATKVSEKKENAKSEVKSKDKKVEPKKLKKEE